MTAHQIIQWKAYLDIYGNLSDKFGHFSKIYGMTTENLLEFVNSLDCLDKNVLTVTGSGDQAMNVILNGAKNITCFDVNPVSFCQLKLKKAAISTLSYEEFLKFFYVAKSTSDEFLFLDRKIFDKVSEQLDDETKDIFNYIYKSFRNNYEIKDSIYFNFFYYYPNMVKMSNYLTLDKYNKLKDILNNEKINIKFINSDFRQLSNKLKNKKYDLILLSNISDYINNMYKENPLENYYNDIMKLTNNLNINGTMQVGYIYTHPWGIRLENPFASDEKREEIFTTDTFHMKLVTSYENDFNQYNDKIITYQKLK